MNTIKHIFVLIGISFIPIIGLSQMNILKVQNNINDQYKLEITYSHNGVITSTTEQIDISSNLQTFDVGTNNVIISFRIKPADCSGPWVDFDYLVYGYGFTVFCLGCDDPNTNYTCASVGYDGKDWVGIKCSE